MFKMSELWIMFKMTQPGYMNAAGEVAEKCQTLTTVLTLFSYMVNVCFITDETLSWKRVKLEKCHKGKSQPEMKRRDHH